MAKTSCSMKLETPRGTFPIHTIYSSLDEAAADGWSGFWFQHGRYLILALDNRVGAVVDLEVQS